VTQVRVLGPQPVDYAWAWDLQRALHDEVVAGESEDTVLLLEHEPVYTAGRRTEPLDRPLERHARRATSGGADGSPGTGRGNWLPTRSSTCAAPGMA